MTLQEYISIRKQALDDELECSRSKKEVERIAARKEELRLLIAFVRNPRVMMS